MNLDAIIADIKNLPPTQPLLPKLLSLLRDDEADSSDIVDIIKLEPSLTAQVLQLSNNAYYGLSTPSRDLYEAVARIGFKEVYKLVALICGGQLINRDMSRYYIDEGKLWEHSLACGLVMENLANLMREDPATHYTIGLLHCIGKIVINELKENNYEEVYNLVEAEGITLIAAEEKVFGFTNAQIGASLLRKWKFPKEICIPIEFQFNPMEAPAYLQTTCMLHISIWVVANLGLNVGKDAWALETDAQALEIIKVTEEELQGILLKAHEQINEIKRLIQESKSLLK